MRRIALLGLAAMMASIACPPPALAATRLDAPVWTDEFSGAALDTSRWSHRQSGPRWDGTLTADAVSVGNGNLTIKTYTQGGTHYSGMIGTQGVGGLGGFEQARGHFEARVRFNSAPGQWSAFWLQSPTMGATIGDPEGSGVEMDIFEHRVRCTATAPPAVAQACAGDISNRVQQALVWDGYGADSKASVTLSEPLPGLGNGSWHTWALEWTASNLTVLYDGQPIWTSTGPISQRSEYLVLSSEIGQFFAGPIPAGGYGTAANSTTSMQVDYVRVWATTLPRNTAAPTVTGTAEAGGALVCSTGTWSGFPTPQFAYQWLVDGTPVAGATSLHYTAQTADATREVGCRVTATNGGGSESASSAALRIAALAPAPVAPAPAPLVPLAPSTYRLVAPDPPPLPPDTDPPDARLSGNRAARLASTVAVVISCPDEACVTTTTGSLRVPATRGAQAMTYRPAAKTAFVAEGARVVVQLRLARAARIAVARALRARARPVLRLRVRVADTAGNARTLTRDVTFRR